MRTFVLLGLFVAMFLPVASPGWSATFRLGGDASVGCQMTVEGEIVAGDAEKFRQLIADFVNATIPADETGSDAGFFYNNMPERTLICLDSPGGSITEAIEMADTLAYGYRIQEDVSPLVEVDWTARTATWQMGTAVAAGARCESACAILFMAGGFFSQLGTSNNVRDPNRILHVDGKLGFHAPSLVVPGGEYNEASVSQAFGLAISAVESLSQRLGRYSFPPSLFQRMMSTPPDEMFYVETVEEAASWYIALEGTPLMDGVSLGNMRWVCDNMVAVSGQGLDRGEQYSIESTPEDIRSSTIPMFGLARRVGISEGGYLWKYALDGEDRDIEGYYEHREFDCEFDYDTATGEIVFLKTPRTDHGLTEAGTFGGLIQASNNYGWMLFPGYTTKQDLSNFASQGNGRVPGSALMRPLIDVMGGVCVVYDTSGELALSERCEATMITQQRADRRDHVDTFSVSWPAGQDPNGGGAIRAVTPVNNGGTYVVATRRDEAGDLLEVCHHMETDNGTRCFVWDSIISSTPSVFHR